jgi:hypothetical protein
VSNNYNRSFNTPGAFITQYWDGHEEENFNITKHRTVNTRSGVTTPNYQELAREGRLPMQPFSYRRYKRHGAQGERVFTDLVGDHDYGTYRNYGDWNAMAGGLSATLVATNGLTSNERDDLFDLANIKALNDIKSQKVNILQDLGEARQTLRLLTSTATRLAGAYNSFRRGNLLEAAKTLGAAKPSRRYRKKYELNVHLDGLKPRKKFGASWRPSDGSVFSPQNLSSLWLEFSYGWRPLVSSVQGAIELFNQQIVSGEIIRAESTFKNYTKEVTTGLFNTYYGWESNWVNESERTYSVKHVCYYSVADVDAVLLSQSGISNPLNLAWELVPFSFVVDWFINVGSFLSSLDATNGLAFSKGCYTTCYKVNAIKTSVSTSTIPEITACHGEQVSTVTDFQLDRVVLSDFPAPRPPGRTQRSLGLNKYLTAVALLTTIVFGKGKQPLYRMR